MKERRLPGKLLSITSTSRENLLTILPRGVVSKNDIGALIMRFSILLWRSPEARRQPNASTTLLANDARANEIAQSKTQRSITQIKSYKFKPCPSP